MSLLFALGLALVPAQEGGTRDAPDSEPPPPDASTLRTLLERVEVGGQERLRAEYRDLVSYADTPAAREDDDLYLSRLRVDLGFVVDEDLDIFFQAQDQRAFGDEASVASDENNLDVHQAYVEFRNLAGADLSVRAGRQELRYGDQRLVSPLDWSNVGRAWDGIKVRYDPGDAWVEGFATVVREGGAAGDDRDFLGLYGSYEGVPGHAFDAYVFARLYQDKAFVDESGRAGDLRDLTTGIRIKGAGGPLDYSMEVAAQSGEHGGDDISAGAVAATAGVTFPHSWSPRVGVEVAFATGDEDPLDGKRQTFDPLFPFGHFYGGFADMFSFRNGRDWVLHLEAAPIEGLVVRVDVHRMELDEARDAWYHAGGGVLRRDVTGAADPEVGRELDVHAKVKAGRGITFWGGWSHFFAGPYVRDTPGPRRDMDWFFLQMTIDF